MNRTILAKLLIEVSAGRTTATAALEMIDREIAKLERENSRLVEDYRAVQDRLRDSDRQLASMIAREKLHEQIKANDSDQPRGPKEDRK
jgi:hypothetical protein